MGNKWYGDELCIFNNRSLWNGYQQFTISEELCSNDVPVYYLEHDEQIYYLHYDEYLKYSTNNNTSLVLNDFDLYDLSYTSPIM